MSKSKFYDVAKRTIDVVTAITVGLIFSPLIILICLAIVLDSPGPIIYRHRRVGKNGKIFYLWKFRSMYDRADERFLSNKKFMKDFKRKEGWKFNNAGEDPRITRVGRFTRKYSLDELPNIVNILHGEMSMVGPRAYRKDLFGDEIAEMLKIYPDLSKILKVALSVKPGVTGPWQVAGRNKIPFDQRVQLDADYAKQKSLWQDIVILLKTPFAMLNRW
ncbi:sugar transferase [Candidatus Microgenomates bacterium]|nr:sugar transferase [Candidatus Microgenomates bacterium]